MNRFPKRFLKFKSNLKRNKQAAFWGVTFRVAYWQEFSDWSLMEANPFMRITMNQYWSANWVLLLFLAVKETLMRSAAEEQEKRFSSCTKNFLNLYLMEKFSAISKIHLKHWWKIEKRKITWNASDTSTSCTQTHEKRIKNITIRKQFSNELCPGRIILLF